MEQDETEQGMRKALNFGHTIGHGIEAVKGIKAAAPWAFTTASAWRWACCP